MLKIAFVKSPDGQCMQTNMMMALRYFFPDKKFSFCQINKKMHRKKGKWTFPTQAAVALKDFGLKAKAYSSEDISTERKRIIAGFKKAFGKDYNTVIKNIDLNTTEYFHKRTKKEKVFEVCKNSLKDLEKCFEKGYLVIPCVDSNVLHKEKGSFRSHFVTIVNMDKNNVWIHDPSEGPNIKYSRKLFNKAYTVQAIDDDALVIFGKSSK